MPCPKCIEYEWPDPQEPVEGSEFCVFHAPAEEKGVTTEKFNQLIFNRISAVAKNKSETRNRPACHLSGSIFPGDISFRALNEKIQFPPTDFSFAIFNGTVDLRYTEFERVTSFSNVVFNCKVLFDNSVFGPRESHDTVLSTSFHDSVFMCGASFNNVHFNSMTFFTRTIFEDKATFIGSKINNSVLFFGVIFSGNVSFERMVLKDKFIIASSKMIGKTSFVLSYGEANAIQIIDAKESSIKLMVFRSFEVEIISFKHCDFPEKLAVEGENSSLLAGIELYRSLKQKAASEHDQPMVSKWHYREKLIQLKAEFNVTNNLINLLEQIEDSNLKIKSRLKTWFKLLLARPWRSKLSWLFWYWSTSGFGERPKRAGFVLIGLALFPLICLAIAAVIETGPALSINTTRAAQVVVDWLRLISFIKQEAATTDSSLLGASKLTLSSAWQLLIALQAALFGFALRNKFRR